MASGDLLVTTALVAVTSAVVSLLVGYPVGHWLSSLRALRRIVTGLLLVPFLLPAFLVGLALRPLMGEALDSSWVALGAIISAHVLMNAGFIAVVTAASLHPPESNQSLPCSMARAPYKFAGTFIFRSNFRHSVPQACS